MQTIYSNSDAKAAISYFLYGNAGYWLGVVLATILAHSEEKLYLLRGADQKKNHQCDTGNDEKAKKTVMKWPKNRSSLGVVLTVERNLLITSLVLYLTSVLCSPVWVTDQEELGRWSVMPWTVVPQSVICFFLCADFWNWVNHYAAHHTILRRFMHKHHHQWHHPEPISAFDADWLDQVFCNSLPTAITGTIVTVPFHWVRLGWFIVTCLNTFCHGEHLMSSSFLARLLPDDHLKHHQDSRCYYGLIGVADRLFATTKDGKGWLFNVYYIRIQNKRHRVVEPPDWLPRILDSLRINDLISFFMIHSGRAQRVTTEDAPWLFVPPVDRASDKHGSSGLEKRAKKAAHKLRDYPHNACQWIKSDLDVLEILEHLAPISDSEAAAFAAYDFCHATMLKPVHQSIVGCLERWALLENPVTRRFYDGTVKITCKNHHDKNEVPVAGKSYSIDPMAFVFSCWNLVLNVSALTNGQSCRISKCQIGSSRRWALNASKIGLVEPLFKIGEDVTEGIISALFIKGFDGSYHFVGAAILVPSSK